MAAVTFHLVSLNAASNSNTFIDELSALPEIERPLWVGNCHHWIHEPRLSVNALQGPDTRMKAWAYLLIFKSPGSHSLPAAVQDHVEKKWSISVADIMVDSLPPRKPVFQTQFPPALPMGWSAENSTELDVAVSPEDLELSLGVRSHAFGASKFEAGTQLRDFIRNFGIVNSGPVAMLNLLAYLPDQRPRYLEYITAFGEILGPAYGGEALVFGTGAMDWSSQLEERVAGQEGEWEDVGLVQYPTIWHFAKMLDDPAYADLDRKFKREVLRSNAILCCTEVRLPDL